jgi:hypothetical protein
VLGQAKNRSPVHLLARYETRRHEMFRLASALSQVKNHPKDGHFQAKSAEEARLIRSFINL